MEIFYSKNGKEIWKDIPEYKGLYQVSSKGRIKSIPHSVKANKDGGIRTVGEHIIKTYVGWHGYVWVTLCKNGKSKTHSVHRLVAMVFIPNSDKKLQVNHIDGNKENNLVENLEWCTNSGNQLHAVRNGLSKIAKKVVCLETGKTYASSGEAQRNIGICGRNIRSCCDGRYKTAGGYHWKWG